MSIWALVSWQPSFFELALIWGWKSDVRRRHRATKKAESRIKGRWERKTSVMEEDFGMDPAGPRVASSHSEGKAPREGHDVASAGRGRFAGL